LTFFIVSMLIIYQYTSYKRCDFRTKGYGRTTVKKSCHIVFILKLYSKFR